MTTTNTAAIAANLAVIAPIDRGFSSKINNLIASFGVVLARGLLQLERVINLPEWGWIEDRLAIFGHCPEMGLTEEETRGFETTSCLPDLWVLRAWGAKRGIPVPRVDWAYYKARELGLFRPPQQD
jgi:hypothetical protein